MQISSQFETLLCIGLIVTFSSVSCGHDGDGDGDGQEPSNKYTCRCNCDLVGPYIPSGLYAELVPYDRAFVCARDLEEAKWKCATACVNYERDVLADTHSTSQCRDCKLDPAFPPLLRESGKCTGTVQALLSGLPPTATIEGPIDFGVSFAEIEIPSQDDGARVNLKGKIAVVGGNCRDAQCPIEVWYLDVGSLPPTFLTRKGRTVENLAVINEGVWAGTKYSDNTFLLSPASQISLSATVDDRPLIDTLSPAAPLQGKIIYGGYRGNTLSNAIVVDGTYAEGEYRTQLHILTWIANCQPVVNATAYCYRIDPNEPPSLMLYSNLGLLGNIQDQDLCNAMRATDPVNVCRPGGSTEFPTFTCTETALPNPSDQNAVSQHLSLSWRDAAGRQISDQAVLSLRYMPAFPLTLRVENQWGRGVESVIQTAPQGSCPAAVTPILPPVADAGHDQILSNIETKLNGSRSFDPQGGPLMFSWRFVSWRPNEDFPPTGDFHPAISNGNTATPVVLMPQFGDYVFELKVTNSARQTSAAYVHVTRKPCAECGR